VVEQAMAGHSVLPVRFGTVLGNMIEVRTILTRFAPRLVATFGQLGRAIEVEVAATWDLKRTFAEIGREREIAALAATAAGQSSEEGRATRVQIGALVKQRLDDRRDTYRRLVVDALRLVVADNHPNPIVADEMVLNVAFLVDGARLAEFYATVHRLDETLDNRLTFRCIGPLPPYSFATVEVARPRPAEIAGARRLLELGEQVTEGAINVNYRRLALRYHPDRHPDDPSAQECFAALTAAHARLLAYARDCRPDGRSDDSPCDLSEAAVESTILLTIKRLASEPLPAMKVSGERDVARV
jgi:hypothetical protein